MNPQPGRFVGATPQGAPTLDEALGAMQAAQEGLSAMYQRLEREGLRGVIGDHPRRQLQRHMSEAMSILRVGRSIFTRPGGAA